MNDRDRKPPFRRGGGKSFEKGRRIGGRPAWREREATADGPVILYGWHTVAAALANPERQIRKLFLTENAARRLADENIDTRVAPEIVRGHAGIDVFVGEAAETSIPAWPRKSSAPARSTSGSVRMRC